MSAKHILVLGLSLSLFLLFTLIPPARSHATNRGSLSASGEPVWTRWDGQRYDLADDGRHIWIAAAGGILEWDKETMTLRRITVFDGLPDADFFAVAVDPDGNRWFGGNAGLSRLSPDAVWSHYNSDNSDLPYNLIDDIAVSRDGSLWLSHGLPDGPLSRRQSDGNFAFYPNRETAVVQSYDQVKETLNDNNIWTIFGDEIWVGYRVFDGINWEVRLPPNGGASEPIVRAASDTVYTLEPNASEVYAWNGAGWSSYQLSAGYGDALTVQPNDTAWVSWQYWIYPHFLGDHGLSRLPEEPGVVEEVEHFVGVPNALLATQEGLWGVGPGWLLHPDWSISQGEDGPASDPVAGTILSTEGALYVQSGRFVQTLDDQGTTLLDDDEWVSGRHVAEHVTAVERVAGGGVWFAGYTRGRFYFDDMYRYHEGEWIFFPISTAIPLSEAVYDIFAQNAQVTWFAYAGLGSYGGRRGVKRLDDGGTPADISDDVWTDYPIDSEGRLQHLAVDGLGRIWAAGDADLYLHDGNTWQPYFSNENGYPICDIVAFDDGTLFLQSSYFCERPFEYDPNEYMIIRPDGLTEQFTVDSLLREAFDRIISTSQRNRMWTVAPDGAVWYADDSVYGEPVRLERYDGIGTTTFDLPFQYYDYQGGPLEVDENNHLWLVNDGLLWRLSLMPGFALAPDVVLLSPGSTRHRTVAVYSISGYGGAITLQLTGLPEGITHSFQTNPVSAGEATQLILTANSAVPLGTYIATLEGDDGVNTNTVPLTVTVVSAVHDTFFPLTVRP